MTIRRATKSYTCSRSIFCRLQLQPDAVEALDAAVDPDHRHLRVLQLRPDLGEEVFDDALGSAPLLLDPRAQRFVARGLQILEGELLELVLDLGHAQPVRDGSVNVERLLRRTHTPLVGHELQRPHVVESIRQLDEDDANVVHHRQQHLAEVLDLPLLAGRKRDGADFRDTLDDVRDVVAEGLANSLDRRQGVFDDVVQQAGGHAHDVELHVRQDVGDFERMDEIRLARMADLPLVLEGRKHVRPAEQLEVCVWAVAPDLFEEVLEANHDGLVSNYQKGSGIRPKASGLRHRSPSSRCPEAYPTAGTGSEGRFLEAEPRARRRGCRGSSNGSILAVLGLQRGRRHAIGQALDYQSPDLAFTQYCCGGDDEDSGLQQPVWRVVLGLGVSLTGCNYRERNPRQKGVPGRARALREERLARGRRKIRRGDRPQSRERGHVFLSRQLLRQHVSPDPQRASRTTTATSRRPSPITASVPSAPRPRSSRSGRCSIWSTRSGQTA